MNISTINIYLARKTEYFFEIQFIENLLKILRYLNQNLNSLMNNFPLDKFYSNIKQIYDLEEKNEKFERFTMELKSFKKSKESQIEKMIEEKKLEFEEKQKKKDEKKKEQTQKTIDEVIINYTRTGVYPNLEECFEKKGINCFPHILDGAYPSINHYFNNMFHLLREVR